MCLLFFSYLFFWCFFLIYSLLVCKQSHKTCYDNCELTLNTFHTTEWEKADTAQTQPEPKSPESGGGDWGVTSTSCRTECGSPSEPGGHRELSLLKRRQKEVGCCRAACASSGSANSGGHLCYHKQWVEPLWRICLKVLCSAFQLSTFSTSHISVSRRQAIFWRRQEEMGSGGDRKSSNCPLCSPTNSRGDVQHDHRWVGVRCTSFEN